MAVIIDPPAPAAVVVLLGVEPLERGAHLLGEIGLHLWAGQPHLVQRLIGEDVGQEAADGLLDAFVGIVLQIIQRVLRGGGERAIHLDGQPALRTVELRRQLDQLLADLRLRKLAGGRHHLRRGVVIDRKRVLAAIVIAHAVRRRLRLHRDLDLPLAPCPLHRDRPDDLGLLAGGELDLLLRAAGHLDALGGEDDLGGERARGVVMDDGGDVGLVADDEEARQDGTHQHIQGAANIYLAAPHGGLRRDAPRPHPPGGEVIRQLDLDAGAAVRVGLDDRVPEGRIGELGPNEGVPGAAPAALRARSQLTVVGFHRDGQRHARPHADAALAPEALQQRGAAIFGQRQHGQIGQAQRKLRRDRVAGVIGDLHIVGRRLARAIVRALLDGAIRRQRDVQALLLDRDGQLDQAHLEAGQAVGRLIRALDDDDGDEDVGNMRRLDGHADDLGVALQGAHLAGEEVAALDGNQRPDSTGVGRGDQNLGHVADLVIVFIGDQVDAIVALLPPARAAAAPHPEIGAAADLVALRILARGEHLVAARFFRREGDRRFPVVIGGGCRGVDGHILRDPRPVGEAILGLLADAVPAVLHKDDLERLIRHGAALPIDRQQIDGLGLTGLRDPVARAYADVVLALVDDGGGAIADVAPVEISNVGLEGEALAA